jgi:cation:H+ antiporter
MPDFTGFSLPLNLAIFAAAAAVVWFAGTRISWYADEIGQRTGMSEALMGMLLLAGVSSLPEIATSFTAAHGGDVALGFNDVLGSIALQVTLLAIADLMIGRHALTAILPNPVLMLQGALGVVLLSLTAIAAVVGDVPVFGVGLWTLGLCAGAVFSFWKIAEADRRTYPWVANQQENADTTVSAPARHRPKVGDAWPVLSSKVVLAVAAILAAGFVVARAGSAMAEQTGLGSSFMGVVFLALTTSLAETSMVFSAVRLGLYTMAVSEILSTNIINLGLLVGVDAMAPGEPVMNVVGDFAAVAAMLGACVTAILVMGLAERRDRSFLRMGEDSIAILMVYGGGLVLLFTLR